MLDLHVSGSFHLYSHGSESTGVRNPLTPPHDVISLEINRTAEVSVSSRLLALRHEDWTDRRFSDDWTHLCLLTTDGIDSA